MTDSLSIEPIEKLIHHAELLNVKRRSVFDIFSEKLFGAGTEISALHAIPGLDRSIFESFSQIEFVCKSVIERANFLREFFLFIPRRDVIDLCSFFEIVYSEIEEIDAKNINSLKNDGKIEFDGENLVFQTNSETNIVPVAEYFDKLNQNIDILIALLFSMNFGLGQDNNSNIRVNFPNLAKVIGRISDTINISVEKIDQIDQKFSEVEQIFNEFREKKVENTIISQEIFNNREESRINLKEIEKNIEQVRAISNEYAEIRQNYLNYSTEIKAFLENLNNTNQNIDEIRDAGNVLLKEFGEKSAQVEELIQLSETMLEGSTNVGLASAYSDLRNRVSRELYWATIGFYISIIFLSLSILPLMFYVVPEFSSIFGISLVKSGDNLGGTNVFDLMGQIIVRALLLVPAAWLTRFTAHRHSILFRLKEHYSHKFSMAASVAGFKQQAPKYNDEIAALTFFELVKNSANDIDTEKNSHTEGTISPLLDAILNQIATRKEH